MKQRFPEKQVLTRYLFIEAIFFIIGIGIIAKTAYIMFVERGYWKQVNSRFEKSRWPPPCPSTRFSWIIWWSRRTP